MFEFHGWVNIVEDDTDDSDISILDDRRDRLTKQVEYKIKDVESCNSVFRIFRNLNGENHFILTGFSNHRQQSVVDLFYWIAEKQPNSYGLLHIRDDEDKENENVFRVFALTQGAVCEKTEKLLSPCIPKIEKPFDGL